MSATEGATPVTLCAHRNPPGCLACRAELAAEVSHYEKCERRASALLDAVDDAAVSLQTIGKALDMARRHGDDGDLSGEDYDDGREILADAARSVRSLRRLAALHDEAVCRGLAEAHAEEAASRG